MNQKKESEGQLKGWLKLKSVFPPHKSDSPCKAVTLEVQFLDQQRQHYLQNQFCRQEPAVCFNKPSRGFWCTRKVKSKALKDKAECPEASDPGWESQKGTMAGQKPRPSYSSVQPIAP